MAVYDFESKNRAIRKENRRFFYPLTFNLCFVFKLFFLVLLATRLQRMRLRSRQFQNSILLLLRLVEILIE